MPPLLNGKSDNAQTATSFGLAGLGRLLIRAVAALRAWVGKQLPGQIPIAVKLAVYISLIIIVSMSLLGSLIVHNQTQLLNKQMRTTGYTVAGQMAESAKEPLLADDHLLLQVLTANLASGENITGTAIYGPDRSVIVEAGHNPFERGAPYHKHTRPFLDGTAQSLTWSWPQSPAGPLDAVSFVTPVHFKDTIVGYVLISFDRSAMNQSLTDSVRSIVVATLLLIVLGIAFSYVIGRRLSRPIHHLMNASRAIHQGNYGYQIDERRNDEIGYLIDAFNNMAQGLFEKAQVEEAFSRYVPTEIARNILEDLEQVQLGGTRINASVLFVDIVGFTARSESMSPEEVAQLLNEFYSNISHAARAYRGTIDKYLGDGAMLVFGLDDEDPDHAFRSIACAVFFQRLAERMNGQRVADGKFPVYFRIGTNTGDMLAGNIGTADRVQFTVVGDSVNLASRLCSVATAGEIVITEEIHNHPSVHDRVVASQHKSIRLRGKSKPVSTYLVHDVDREHRAEMQQTIDSILESDSTDT